MLLINLNKKAIVLFLLAISVLAPIAYIEVKNFSRRYVLSKLNRVELIQSYYFDDTDKSYREYQKPVKLTYREGARYGWKIQFKSKSESISFGIEEVRSRKPDSDKWSPPQEDYIRLESLNRSEDGKESKATVNFRMKDEWDGLAHFGIEYVIERGDPLGEHSIVLYADGVYIQTFVFDLVASESD